MRGDKSAQCNLGWNLLEGKGAEKDSEEAFFWLDLSLRGEGPSAKDNCRKMLQSAEKKIGKVRAAAQRRRADAWQPE